MFQGAQSGFEVIFERIDRVEYQVVEEFLTQLVPKVFYRVEFWRVGRQGQQPNIVRHLQGLACVPACTVQYHDNFLVRMTRGDFLQKDLHAVCIDVRQDQTVEMTAVRIDGSIALGVFMGQHGAGHRAQRIRRPGAPYIGDSTESRLVLEHQADGRAPGELLPDLRKRVWKFFSTPAAP
jgi:hypothetical protein